MVAPFTWSYSHLSGWRGCKKRYWHTQRAPKGSPDKIVEPKSSYQIEGDEVHKAIELRLRIGKALPFSLARLEPTMGRLSQLPGEKVFEQRLGLTRELQPCDFFAKDVWFRAVIDFAAIGETMAAVVDHKTGKQKNTDDDQLMLMAATIMAYKPSVQQIAAGFYWTKTDKIAPLVFSTEDIRKMWVRLAPELAEMEQAYLQGARAFPPEPCGLCKEWCPVASCGYHGVGR